MLLTACLAHFKETVQEAAQAATLTERRLRRLRSDEEYDRFYEQVVQSCQGLTEDPVLPRKRKIPKRLNDGADQHQYMTPTDYHGHQYFQAVDEVANELSRRFDQKDLKIAVDMDKMLLSACLDDKEATIPEAVLLTYQNDLQMQQLQAQLKLLPDLVSQHREISGTTMKFERYVIIIMNANPVTKTMCPELLHDPTHNNSNC